MTTRSSPTEIITYLNANWVIGTIAKPTFVNQFENEQIGEDHSLGVNWAGWDFMPASTGASPLDEETNTLTIQINDLSIANMLTTFDHARSLLRNKDVPVASGHYMITEGRPMKVGGHYTVFMTVEEVMRGV